MEHPFLMFLEHTQLRSTVGRTLLDKWSARRRDLYLTTHDTLNRQKSMPPVGFEPKISAGERPQPLNRKHFLHALTSLLPETAHSWTVGFSSYSADEMTSFGRLALPNWICVSPCSEKRLNLRSMRSNIDAILTQRIEVWGVVQGSRGSVPCS